jgi:hypothetical protein
MSDDPLHVSVPEVVCANSALIRTLLMQLIGKGLLSSVDLYALFEITQEDLAGGRYEPSTVDGAQAYVENLRDSIEAPFIMSEPELTQ